MSNSINKILFLLLVLIILLDACSSSKKDQPFEAVVPVEGPAPTAANLLKPSNNSVCEEGKVLSKSQSEISFSWDPSQNTDTYEVKVTNLNVNTSFTRTVTHPTTSLTEIFERGIPYSWQVKSKSTKTTKTAESAEWKFYLSREGSVNYAPFPATIVSPKSGEIITLTDGKYTLSWIGNDPDQGSTLSYQVFIDTSMTKVATLDIKPINSAVANTSVQLSSNTVYYWRVKTSDGQNSSYTILYSFKTK
jgi:hypothetical protein